MKKSIGYSMLTDRLTYLASSKVNKTKNMIVAAKLSKKWARILPDPPCPKCGSRLNILMSEPDCRYIYENDPVVCEECEWESKIISDPESGDMRVKDVPL